MRRRSRKSSAKGSSYEACSAHDFAEEARPRAAFAVQMENCEARQFGAKRIGKLAGQVSAGVVGDGYLPGAVQLS